MYQFSRAIYRELAPLVAPSRTYGGVEARDQAHVLHCCEAAVERLVADRHYFARPARSLFNDIRSYFPMGSQVQVYRVVSHYMNLAREFAAQQPVAGYDANGDPLVCRATTRKGTPCQRTPLPHNGYCPSHQHLAATEDTEVLAA
jgi:hypothetical protein